MHPCRNEVYRDLDKYDRLLGDEADLQTLIDVTQELFPIEMLAKVIVSIVEVSTPSFIFIVWKKYTNTAGWLCIQFIALILTKCCQ